MIDSASQPREQDALVGPNAPGHREGALLRRCRGRSAIGSPVERSSRYMPLLRRPRGRPQPTCGAPVPHG